MNDEANQSADQARGFGQIVRAVAKATGEVKRIAKENKNTEQRYDFASVDDFLAMTGPVLANNGLMILMDEEAAEHIEKQGKFGPQLWAKYTFSFEVMHESGETLRVVRRTVEVMRSGAQASGSAQSYALKQFVRALLQIPTGDKDDPDHGAIEPTAPKEPRSSTPRQQAQRQQPDVDPVQMAVESLDAAKDLEALASIWSSLGAVQRNPRAIEAKDKRKAALQNPDNGEKY